MPPETNIPEKLYFRIGEVSEIAGVPSYVLRFWETEFPSVKPRRTESGQRLYRKVDVERILLIKRLLHDQRFTIQGARQYLRQADRGLTRADLMAEMEAIQRELRTIRQLLE
ncbi:MAG: MerR family transcriptional regulator [Desulfobacterales bacterium]|nr:MerR family transcriptional regulator [Desulfobacterales bacterium]MDJ0875705.1 MerR family transcriptional regulator [Desulfobacterales bacterium]MDJ0884745.1 MerR family transcriptional regulator [Desulfobacterales bacterium]